VGVVDYNEQMASSAPRFRNRYRIPSARLTGWDYRQPGMYFVTICTLWRDRCLGEVAGGEVRLSPYGEIIAREWQRIPGRHAGVILDAWIVMPDHLHGILILEPAPPSPAASLGTVIGQFKSKSTKGVRGMAYRGFAWQERFHEHIIGNLEELGRVRDYIRQNPQRWEAKQNEAVTPSCSASIRGGSGSNRRR
jgi:REP-associated tyrosine transposase